MFWGRVQIDFTWSPFICKEGGPAWQQRRHGGRSNASGGTYQGTTSGSNNHIRDPYPANTIRTRGELDVQVKRTNTFKGQDAEGLFSSFDLAPCPSFIARKEHTYNTSSRTWPTPLLSTGVEVDVGL